MIDEDAGEEPSYLGNALNAKPSLVLAMKYCPECGTQLPSPNPNFCPNCGIRLIQTQQGASPPSVVEKTTEVSKTIETGSGLTSFPGSKVRVAGLIGLILLLISGAIPWLTTLSLFDAYGLISNSLASWYNALNLTQNLPIPPSLSAVLTFMSLTLVLYPLSVIVAVFGVAVNRVNLNNVAGVLAIIASIFWIFGVEMLKANLGFFSLGVWIGSGTYLSIVAGIILIATRFVVKTKTPS